MQKLFNFYQKVKFTFLNQHHIWPVWYVFSCISGICFFFTLKDEPKIGVIIPLLFLAIYLYFIKFKVLKSIDLKTTSILLIFFCIGFISSYFRTQNLPLINDISTNEIVTISGNIDHIDKSADAYRYILSKLRIDNLEQNKLPTRIRVTTRSKKQKTLEIGDRVIFDARISSPKLPDIHEGFDYSRWLYFNNIQAVGYVIGNVTKLKYNNTKPSEFRHFFKKLREKVKLNIDHNITKSETNGFLKAILTGDKTYLNKDARQQITYSGLAHLLAISGLHMSIFAGFIFVLLRVGLSGFYRFFLHIPASKIAAIFTLIFCFVYLQLANAPISAIRAYIMISVILLAVLMARRISPIRSLTLAAFIICLYTPEAVLGPSMQMSFAAVLSIVCTFSFLDSKFKLKNKANKEQVYFRFFKNILKYLLLVFVSTAVANLSTSLYAAFHFNRFSGLSILSNVIAIPLASFVIMPFAIIAMLLSILGLGLEYPFYYISGIGIDIVFWLAENFGKEEFSFNVNSISPWQVYLFTLGMVWLLVWNKHIRLLGIAFILASFCLFLVKKQPDIILAASGKNFAVKVNEQYYTYKKDRSYFYKSLTENMNVNSTATIKNNNNILSEFSCNTISCTFLYKSENITIPFGKKLPNGTKYMYIKDNKTISAKDYVGNRRWYSGYELD